MRGNSKLHSSILVWNITPVETCLNCNDCKKDCYALRPYNRYPNVKKAWDRNYKNSMYERKTLKQSIIDQINRSRTVTSIRIHGSGDFYSSDYALMWYDIARICNNVKFYGYSKVFEHNKIGKVLDVMNTLSNVNIINSVTDDGGINFGDVKRVDKLYRKGYIICPATMNNNKIICGEHCTACIDKPKVCFNKH